MLRSKMRWMWLVLSLVPIIACSAEQGNPAGPTIATSMDVYKSPTCGCCGDWIEHMQSNSFGAVIHHPEDLNRLKADKGIAPQYQSCHTAVTAEGYLFEGHVPAKHVRQFLEEKPAGAIGLSVPGMPVGSPGMEVGDRFMPYQVLLLKQDGSAEVYAEIRSPADQ